MSNAMNVRVEKLNKENYDTWCMNIEAILIKNDLWEYVDGTKVKPTEAAAAAEWDRQDKKAKADIILTMNSSELCHIRHCQTSRAVWLKLEAIFKPKGPARKATLLKQLLFTKLTDNNDMSDHLNKFFTTIDKLNEINITVAEDLLTILLLYSIPSNYDNFRCAIEARDELPTPEALKIKLLEEFESRKEAKRETETQQAFNTRSKTNNLKSRGYYNKSKSGKNYGSTSAETGNISVSNPKLFKCNYCHKPGHKAVNCWKRESYKQTQACNVENEAFMTSIIRKKQEAHIGIALNATMSKKEKEWCIDSGATSHMCNNKSLFSSLQPTQDQVVYLAADKIAKVVGEGTVCLKSRGTQGQKEIQLKNVLYVPELRTNLLSVSRATESGRRVIFQGNSVKILNTNDEIIITGRRKGNLFYAGEMEISNNVVAVTESNNFVKWHQRYGHLNEYDLRKLVFKEMVNGLKLNAKGKLPFCEYCAKGKQTTTPFKKDGNRKYSKVLELVHSDVCGPMQTTSIGGSRYFVTFTDEFSNWVEVYCMKSKREVKEIFLKYKTMAENQTGRRIKCLRTDNGLEYCSNEFKRFLEENGIRHERSAAYTPDQNGTAERMNRTLVEMARSMILQADMSKGFWAEAVTTAAYIRNRCPSRKLQDKTPHEIWLGYKPNVAHFRIFGSRAFTLEKKVGQDKFESKSKECIFVGYSKECKAYRLWNPSNHKVVIARDVKFNEESLTKENPNIRELVIDTEEKEKNEQGKSNVIENEDDATEKDDEMDEIDDENYCTPPSHVDDESDDSVITIHDTPRVAAGRPKILRTGKRGRPRKIYNTVNNITEHQANLACVGSEILVEEAMAGPDAEDWKREMKSEFNSLVQNNCWSLIKRPKNVNVIGSRWVLKIKYDPDGNVERRRARLVAKGYGQRQGIDYDETFAPVARLSSLRTLIALSIDHNLKLFHLDVVMAYINGVLNEDVYMEQAEHFVNTEKPDYVYKLNRSIYGLKQSGRQWSIALSERLQDLNFTRLSSDRCLYVKRKEKSTIIVLAYVDDLVIATNCNKMFKDLKLGLEEVFEMKDLGTLNYCLGIEFKFHESLNSLFMFQRKYIRDILNKFGMQDSKPISTPLDVNCKLMKEGISNGASENEPFDATLYRSAIGSLMYLSVATRPDIAHAVSKLSQFSKDPRKCHWVAIKRVFRYLRGTENLGLVFRKTEEPLTGFVDADWGGDPDDRKSFTGQCFKMSDAVITWESRKQKSVALSSSEAEYVGLSEAAKEVVYLRRLLAELNPQGKDDEPTTVYCDNQGALKLTQNPVHHSRTKHIQIRHHYAREIYERGEMRVKYIPTEHMTADIFTKGLGKSAHQKCVIGLGLHNVK